MSFYYQNALCLIYPSLYEGFGMPILEAFNNGCPVLLSDINIFHEIAGNAGLYFDPRDGEDLVTKAKALINNHQLRSELINQGRTILENFSWQKSAMKTIEVYNKAAQ